MQKIARRYGNSVVISFTKEEQKLYDIKPHEFYDIEIVKLTPSHIQKLKGGKHGKK